MTGGSDSQNSGSNKNNRTSESKEEFIEERSARINKTEDVFYNKAQIFNRDVSIEIINTYLETLKEEGMKKEESEKQEINILECMGATGIRTIRYVNEIKHSENQTVKFHINDISPRSTEQIRENLAINNIKCNITDSNNITGNKNSENKSEVVITNQDCKVLMESKTCKYNIIDIDPFGSCSPFLPSAINAIKHNGLLLVTSTDTAVLCSNPRKCYIKYGTTIPKFRAGGFRVKNKTDNKSKQAKVENNRNIQNGSIDRQRCHSMSLRVLLNNISRVAASLGCGIEPLVSISVDYYVRLAVRVKRSPVAAKQAFTNNSYVLLCTNCGGYRCVCLENSLLKDEGDVCAINIQNRLLDTPTNNYTSTNNYKCQYRVVGPLFVSSIQCPTFLDLLYNNINNINSINEKDKRLRTFITSLYRESQIKNQGLFDHTLPELYSYLGMDQVPMKYILSKISNSGFKLALSHTNLNGFVSDISFFQLIEVFYSVREELKDIKIKERKIYLKSRVEYLSEEVNKMLEEGEGRCLMFGKDGPGSFNNRDRNRGDRDGGKK